MTEAKKSLDEWRAYVAALSTDALFDVAENANTTAFVRALMEQGHDAAEVHQILLAFAQRFRALEQVPPEGGYVDLDWLADNP